MRRFILGCLLFSSYVVHAADGLGIPPKQYCLADFCLGDPVGKYLATAPATSKKGFNSAFAGAQKLSCSGYDMAYLISATDTRRVLGVFIADPISAGSPKESYYRLASIQVMFMPMLSEAGFNSTLKSLTDRLKMEADKPIPTALGNITLHADRNTSLFQLQLDNHSDPNMRTNPKLKKALEEQAGCSQAQKL